MMIETTRDIRLKDIRPTVGVSEQQLELAQGMVRVNHLYRSALKVAVTQMEILDEEFCSLNDHSPIHHIEYRIKSLDSIEKKLKRRGYELTIDNIYAHIQDVAGIRVICNYLDDIYYLRSLLTRSESYHVIRESDYIKEPKPSGYRSLHLIVEVPIVISEGRSTCRWRSSCAPSRWTCGPVSSTSCATSPSATSRRPMPHACACAPRPSARSTARCRTSTLATNRNTTCNTNTRKVLGFPGVCLYLSRLVCSSGTDKPIQSPIPR